MKDKLQALHTAINWYADCHGTLASLRDVVLWAISEYQFNVDDEDDVDKSECQHQITLLQSLL